MYDQACRPLSRVQPPKLGARRLEDGPERNMCIPTAESRRDSSRLDVLRKRGRFLLRSLEGEASASRFRGCNSDCTAVCTLEARLTT